MVVKTHKTESHTYCADGSGRNKTTSCTHCASCQIQTAIGHSGPRHFGTYRTDRHYWCRSDNPVTTAQQEGTGPFAQPSMGLDAQCNQADYYGVRDAVSVCPAWRPRTLVAKWVTVVCPLQTPLNTWGFALSRAGAGSLSKRLGLLTDGQRYIGGYQFCAAST